MEATASGTVSHGLTPNGQRGGDSPQQWSVDGRGVGWQSGPRAPASIGRANRRASGSAPLDGAAIEELGGNQSCLDGLAEADLISEEHACRKAAGERRAPARADYGSSSMRADRAARSDPGGVSAAISARHARRHRRPRTNRGARRRATGSITSNGVRIRRLETGVRRRDTAQA